MVGYKGSGHSVAQEEEVADLKPKPPTAFTSSDPGGALHSSSGEVALLGFAVFWAELIEEAHMHKLKSRKRPCVSWDSNQSFSQRQTKTGKTGGAHKMFPPEKLNGGE